MQEQCTQNYQQQLSLEGEVDQGEVQPSPSLLRRMESLAVDRVGKKFKRLTVTRLIAVKNPDYQGSYFIKYECKCDCGKTLMAKWNSLNDGNTGSCGCLNRDIISAGRHGHARERGRRTKIYACWQNMTARCRNENHQSYPHYGGRGIKVCDRWLKFENFLEDMGEPRHDTSLDRINNDGNYEPSNCRWVTQKEQMNNRRGLRPMTFMGITRNKTQWCSFFGIGEWVLKKAIKLHGENNAIEILANKYRNGKLVD